ncbi:hypothetical protein [Saccharopolyspora sp. 5N708]|uniref:hypothetical protein n=1 Tax=Saccharopolyspora sp. 5N708 TaxID=3457424 RepID=UPI003FD10CB1
MTSTITQRTSALVTRVTWGAPRRGPVAAVRELREQLPGVSLASAVNLVRRTKTG